MGIKIVVAVTDRRWFEFLRKRSGEFNDVNHWSPSGTHLNATCGELFLFKLKGQKPHVIVGFGVFSHSSRMPVAHAWDVHGAANGVSSLSEFEKIVYAYGKHDSKTLLGCRILSEPVFFEESDWIPLPSWHDSIVATKKYDTSSPEGMDLWHTIIDRRPISHHEDALSFKYGQPTLVQSRLGQSGFRDLILDIYNKRCAISHECTLPVLEAAHIRPYSDEEGIHEASNGILLRSDLHKLFDKGYVTITPSSQLLVSRKIREDFENGRNYYRLNRTELLLPKNPEQRPSRTNLQWHNDEIFLR